jgi:hypothetical protein
MLLVVSPSQTCTIILLLLPPLHLSVERFVFLYGNVRLEPPQHYRHSWQKEEK